MNTRLSKGFIGFMCLAAACTMANAAVQGQSWHPMLASTLLLAAAGTSRMKITLPGITGSMSVNLPFLLLAVVALSPIESVLIACACAVIQTLPQDRTTLRPIRMLFNVSVMACSSGAAGLLFHHPLPASWTWASAPVLMAATTATLFLGQTLPVSIIVALTEAGSVRRIWASIAQLSFPYYVVSAGVSSMVYSASHNVGWLAALLLLPVMFFIHRSLQLYFAQAAAAISRPIAMAATAGAIS